MVADHEERARCRVATDRERRMRAHRQHRRHARRRPDLSIPSSPILGSAASAMSRTADRASRHVTRIQARSRSKCHAPGCGCVSPGGPVNAPVFSVLLACARMLAVPATGPGAFVEADQGVAGCHMRARDRLGRRRFLGLAAAGCVLGLPLGRRRPGRRDRRAPAELLQPAHPGIALDRVLAGRPPGARCPGRDRLASARLPHRRGPRHRPAPARSAAPAGPARCNTTGRSM